MEEPEYHKGEMCPYAESTGRGHVLCQEGYCDHCQIYLDYSDQVASHGEGLSVSDCPLGLKVCYPSCYWWEQGKCIYCTKLDDCHKIKMILDKDLLEFQYAEAIRAVCAKCPEIERN